MDLSLGGEARDKTQPLPEVLPEEDREGEIACGSFPPTSGLLPEPPHGPNPPEAHWGVGVGRPGGGTKTEAYGGQFPCDTQWSRGTVRYDMGTHRPQLHSKYIHFCTHFCDFDNS